MTDTCFKHNRHNMGKERTMFNKCTLHCILSIPSHFGQLQEKCLFHAKHYIEK